MWTKEEQARRDAAIRNMFATSAPTPSMAPTATAAPTMSQVESGGWYDTNALRDRTGKSLFTRISSQSNQMPTATAQPMPMAQATQGLQVTQPLAFGDWLRQKSGLYHGREHDLFNKQMAFKMYQMYLDNHWQMQNLQARYAPEAMSPLDEAHARYYNAMADKLGAQVDTMGQPQAMSAGALAQLANAALGFINAGQPVPEEISTRLNLGLKENPQAVRPAIQQMDDQQFRLWFDSLINTLKTAFGGALPTKIDDVAGEPMLENLWFLTVDAFDEATRRYGSSGMSMQLPSQNALTTPEPSSGKGNALVTPTQLLNVFGAPSAPAPPAAPSAPTTRPTTTAAEEITILGADGNTYAIPRDQFADFERNAKAKGISYTVVSGG